MQVPTVDHRGGFRPPNNPLGQGNRNPLLQLPNNGGMSHVQGLKNSAPNNRQSNNWCQNPVPAPQAGQFRTQNVSQCGRTHQDRGHPNFTQQQVNFSSQQNINIPNQQGFNNRHFQQNIRLQNVNLQNQSISHGNQCPSGANVLHQNVNVQVAGNGRGNFQQGLASHNPTLQYQQGLGHSHTLQQPPRSQQTNRESGQPAFVSQANQISGQPRFVSQANQISGQPGIVSQANQISGQPRFVSQANQIPGQPGFVPGGNQISGKQPYVPQGIQYEQPTFVGSQPKHATGLSQQGHLSNLGQQNNNNLNQKPFNPRNQLQCSAFNPGCQSQNSVFKSGNQAQSSIQYQGSRSQNSVYNSGNHSQSPLFNAMNKSQSSFHSQGVQSSRYNYNPGSQSQSSVYSCNPGHQSQSSIYNQGHQLHSSVYNNNPGEKSQSSVHNQGSQSQRSVHNQGSQSQSSVHNQGSQLQSSVHNQGSQSQSSMFHNFNPGFQSRSVAFNQSCQSQSSMYHNHNQGSQSQSSMYNTKPGNQSQSSVSNSGDQSKASVYNMCSQTQNITNNPISQSQRLVPSHGNLSQPSVHYKERTSQSAAINLGTQSQKSVFNSGTQSQSSVSDGRKLEKSSTSEKKHEKDDSNLSKLIVPKLHMQNISENQKTEKVERKIKSGSRNTNVLINLTGTKHNRGTRVEQWLEQCTEVGQIITNQSSVVVSDNIDKGDHLTSQERVKVTGSKLKSKQEQVSFCDIKEVNQSNSIYQENQHNSTETRDKDVKTDRMNVNVSKENIISDETMKLRSQEDGKKLGSYDIDKEKRDILGTDQLSKNITEISLSDDIKIKQDSFAEVVNSNEIPIASKTYEIAKNINVLISKLSEENLKKSPVKNDTSGSATRKQLKCKSTKCPKKSHDQTLYLSENGKNLNTQLKMKKSPDDTLASEGHLDVERHDCKNEDIMLKSGMNRDVIQDSQTCVSKVDDAIEVHSDGGKTFVTANKTSSPSTSEIPVGNLVQRAAIQNIDRVPGTKNQKSVLNSEVETVDKENQKEAGSNIEICESTEVTNSQESTADDDCINLTNDDEGLDEDKSDEMYPRYNYPNYPQRGRNDYYNPRRDVGPQYRGQNYNRGVHNQFVPGPRGRGGYQINRHEDSYVPNPQHGDNRNFRSDYRDDRGSNFQEEHYNRTITARPSIHYQRYNEGHAVGNRSHDNVNYDQRNDSWNQNNYSRPQSDIQNSRNVRRYQSQQESQKRPENTKNLSSNTQEKLKNESSPHKTSSHVKYKDKEQHDMKSLTDDAKENPNAVKSQETEKIQPSSNEKSPSSNTSQQKINMGCNIYQSDQYFSADGHPEDKEKISPLSNQSMKHMSMESSDKMEIKSPYRNLKRHSSELGKSPKSTSKHLTDSRSDKEQSPSNRNDKEKTPVKRTMSDTTPSVSLSSQQMFAKAKDKMDFSSIKKALSEVKSKQEAFDKSKCKEDQLENSPVHKKSSSEKMQDSANSQIQEKVNSPTTPVLLHKQSSLDETKNTVNNPVQYHQRKSSFEKVQSSPRSRSSSGDSHGMLSPKSVSEHKQRSAFHSVYTHTRDEQLSESSKPSSQENPLSPLDRKRQISGDLKSNKQSVIGSPGQKDGELAWPQASLHTETSNAQDTSETNISLKSATSYLEWKRLKAIQDTAIQKEQERIRPCIELANTPEEYRKLLQQRKQEAKEAREKTKASKSASETEKSVESDIDSETTQLPSLHNTQNSFQTIQDTVETGISDDDIDLEDSDDDDLEAPSFLFSLEEASTRPIPGTPTKLFSNFESPGPCSPLPEPDLTDITKKTLLSSKFSLDQLVSEKNDKSLDQRALEDMHAKLEEGLKKGGFIKDTLEEPVETNEELLPEQQNVVQKLITLSEGSSPQLELIFQFQIFDSVISEVHPGDVIFQPILYQSLFTGSLSLQTCGFSPGTSYIDKYLSQLQPKDYSLLLTSNILKNTLETVSCVEAVLRWLFLLMSVHSNQLVTQGCHKALLEHLNRQVHFKQAPQTWVPTIPDVLSVFCNYGCEVNTILPDNLINSSEDLSAGLVHEETNGNVNHGGNYNLRNLHLILNIIGQALHASPRYSNRQLTELLIILCCVAMDKSHHSEILPHEFQVCIRGVLRCYTCNYWDNNCNELCHTLFKITTHHHNRLYLAQIFPEDKRGSYIRRRLSYLFLQDMFDVGRDTDIKVFKIKCLHVFLPKLHTLVTTDVYQLASAISYLDLAVGNSSIRISDKEDLQYLSDQLKKISGDIKDSVRMLDRSWVKDMMVRICSKWTLYLLSVGSKQKSIFVYAKKKTPAVKIKTVEATQEDISSQSECEEESKGVPNDNKITEIDEIDYEIIDENSNTSDSKTIQSCLIKNENCQREVSSEVGHIVTVKVESPIPVINCDSPMEVDLTLDDGDDLPDLL